MRVTLEFFSTLEVNIRRIMDNVHVNISFRLFNTNFSLSLQELVDIVQLHTKGNTTVSREFDSSSFCGTIFGEIYNFAWAKTIL